MVDGITMYKINFAPNGAKMIFTVMPLHIINQL